MTNTQQRLQRKQAVHIPAIDDITAFTMKLLFSFVFYHFGHFFVDERHKLLDSATQEGVKMNSTLTDTVDWLRTVHDSLKKLEPVSCQKDKLTQQCRDNEVCDVFS